MGVDHKVDVRADRFPEGGHDLQALLFALRRDVSVSVFEIVGRHFTVVWIGLECCEPQLEEFLYFSHRTFWAVEGIYMSIKLDLVSESASNKVIYGYSQRLTFDVPKGDVDGTDDAGNRSLVAQVREPTIDLVPDSVDIAGVLADQHVLYDFAGLANYEASSSRRARAFPNPSDPFVGVDRYK